MNYCLKNNKKICNNIFNIAPMQNLTDSHFHYFISKFSKKVTLYTEMIHHNCFFYKKNLLNNNIKENPIVLQLGGNDPSKLALCAKIGLEKYKYDQINLNIGCPSLKAFNGNFGVHLMKDVNLVIECINSINKVTNLPISIKTRIGLDEYDSYDFLYNFIKNIAIFTNCSYFIIHARKALTNIFNTKKNLNIPKINYEIVYKIKKDLSNLKIIINGNIKNINDSKKHLLKVDGVMIGRHAYYNPRILIKVDNIFFNLKNTEKNEKNIALSMLDYIELQLTNGQKLWSITKHMLNLFRGKKNSKYWRQYISKNSFKKNAGSEVILNALKLIS